MLEVTQILFQSFHPQKPEGFWVSISYRSLQSLSLKVAKRKTINNIRAAIKMKQIQNSHGFQKVSNISKLMHPKRVHYLESKIFSK